PTGGIEEIVLPFVGSARLLNDTVTLVAPAGASKTKLKLTNSFLAPNTVIVVPSQTELITVFESWTRNSSRVTLSSPSLAHTAVMFGTAASRCRKRTILVVSP